MVSFKQFFFIASLLVSVARVQASCPAEHVARNGFFRGMCARQSDLTCCLYVSGGNPICGSEFCTYNSGIRATLKAIGEIDTIAGYVRACESRSRQIAASGRMLMKEEADGLNMSPAEKFDKFDAVMLADACKTFGEELGNARKCLTTITVKIGNIQRDIDLENGRFERKPWYLQEVKISKDKASTALKILRAFTEVIQLASSLGAPADIQDNIRKATAVVVGASMTTEGVCYIWRDVLRNRQC